MSQKYEKRKTPGQIKRASRSVVVGAGMGSHIADFTERTRAVREAEEAREEGRLVN